MDERSLANVGAAGSGPAGGGGATTSSSGGGPAAGSGGGGANAGGSTTSSAGGGPEGGSGGAAAGGGGEAGAGGATVVGNQFVGDPDVVALYNFEASDTIPVDSIGSNTLAQFGSVTVTSSTCRQGSGCALFGVAAGRLERPDAQLSSDFPFKTGTTNDELSVCLWVEPQAIGATQMIAGKCNWVDGNYRSWAVSIGASGAVLFWKGYNAGGSYDTVQFGTPLTDDRWYHVCVSYAEANASAHMRIWDEGAQQLLAEDVISVLAHTTAYVDVPFSIGAQWNGENGFVGRLDELVLFDRVLSVSEIDEIRQGIYGAGT